MGEDIWTKKGGCALKNPPIRLIKNYDIKNCKYVIRFRELMLNYEFNPPPLFCTMSFF